MDRRPGASGPFWALLFAIFGISAGGTLISTRSSQDSVVGLPTGSSTESSADEKNKDAAAGKTPAPLGALEPERFHRALALVADFIETERMYAPDAKGKLVLQQPYLKVLKDHSTKSGGSTSPDWDQDVDALLVAEVKNRVGRTRPEVKLKIVVTTLPDWIDSNSQWTFDPMFSAVQSAASAAGYSLTSFYLPDWEPSVRDSTTIAGARARGKLLHESEPGAVLFRKWVRNPKPDCPSCDQGHLDLLLVLVVGETATGGVHKSAMVSALDLAVRWRGAESTESVRILGPSFTGSSQSLRASIADVAKRLDSLIPPRVSPAFEVLASNASGTANAATLTLHRGKLASFGAVLNQDDTSFEALSNFLGRLNPDWRCGKGMALLREENTAWGGGISVQSNGKNLVNCADTCRKIEDDWPGGGGQSRMPPFVCALTVPFPAHLSRLRTELDSRATGSMPAMNLGGRVKLQLSENRTPIDRLPSFSPELTAANTDTALKQLFSVIRKSDITAIGVLVTDKRDHVFLAREIARRTPHVLQFTYNANLIYLHPEVSSFMRGTIVASTYPLYARTQLLTSLNPTGQFRQFETAGAQGVFNGLLHILDRDDLILDYQSPWLAGVSAADAAQATSKDPRSECRERRCPPVWISVVGRDAILPLESYPYAPHDEIRSTGTARALEAMPYVSWAILPVSEGPGPHDHIRYVFMSMPFLALIIALGLIPALHVARSLSWAPVPVVDAGDRLPFLRAFRDAVRRRWSLLEYRGGVDGATDERTREYRAAFFGSVVSVAMAGLWTAKLLLLWAVTSITWDNSTLWASAFLAYRCISFLVLAAIALAAAWAFWGPDCRAATLGTTPAGAPRSVFSSLAVLAFTVLVLLWQWERPDESLQQYLCIGAGILLSLALVVWPRANNDSGSPSTGRKRADDAAGYVYCRRVVVLVGLAAVASLIAFLITDTDIVNGMLFADRAMSITSSVAPTTFVLFICAAVHWWSVWVERRLDLLLLPDSGIGAGPFILEHARHVNAEKSITSTSPALGGYWWLSPVGVVMLLWIGARHVYTIEGQSFNFTVLVASTGVLTMMLHVLMDTVHFGHGLLRTLASIGKHRISARFELLVSSGLSLRPTFKDVHINDLEPMTERLLDVTQRLQSTNRPEIVVIRGLTSDLYAAITRELNTNPSAAVSEALWARIRDTSERLRTMLQTTKWAPAAITRGWSEEDRATIDDAEFVVLMFNALIIRDLVTRLLSGFSAVVGGLILLMLAHLLYVFQGRPFWLAIDWVAIAVTTVFAMGILLRLEQDKVLSELWGTQPGRITLFGGVSFRVAAYALVTILTMFAVFFPEVGGGLLRWLRPMQQAIP